MENAKDRSVILTALHEVMEKVTHAPKDGKNDFHNYPYATEYGLLKSLRPAMVEAGLMLIPSCTHRSEIDEHGNIHVSIDYTLAHKSGAVWPEKITGYGCGNDKAKNGKVGDKGIYKAITGANKYVLFKVFHIPTGDDPEKDEKNSKETKEETTETKTETQQGNANGNESINADKKQFIYEYLNEQAGGREKVIPAKLQRMLMDAGFKDEAKKYASVDQLSVNICDGLLEHIQNGKAA